MRIGEWASFILREVTIFSVLPNLLQTHCPFFSIPGEIVKDGIFMASGSAPTSVGKDFALGINCCSPFMAIPGDVVDNHVVVAGGCLLLLVLELIVAINPCLPVAAAPGFVSGIAIGVG